MGTTNVVIAMSALGIVTAIGLAASIIREGLENIRRSIGDGFQDGTQAIDYAGERVKDEVRELRLTARTRVGKVAPQTGIPDPDGPVRRMGASTRAKRVVVGGTPGSAQREKLERSLVAEDED